MEKHKIKLIPKTSEEWSTFLETSIKGGALITDILFTGGTLGFLVGIGSNLRFKKAIKELGDLTAELKRDIHKNISVDYLKSDEFLVFVSNAVTEAMRSKNIEKIKYFKSAIVNGMVKTDLEKGKKILFVDCLSGLSEESILLLILIDRMCNKRGNKRLTFREIQKECKCTDIDYLMANLKALDRFSLIEIPSTTPVREAGEENYYANYPVNHRPFGEEFISFIMEYCEKE